MAKLTTDWSAIITSAPLNKDAAVARDGKGEEFIPRKNLESPGFLRRDAPFKTKPYPGRALGKEDLTGQRFNKLTVIGYLAEQPSNNSGRWVVRCVCGYYEIRKGKALKSPKYQERASCSLCDYNKELREGRAGIEFPKIDAGRRA